MRDVGGERVLGETGGLCTLSGSHRLNESGSLAYKTTSNADPSLSGFLNSSTEFFREKNFSHYI